MHRLLTAATAAALLVTACTDDGRAGQFADALANQFSTGAMADHPDRARCFAPVVVEVLGADRLSEAGFEPETITDVVVRDPGRLGITRLEATDLAQGFVDCAGGPVALVAEQEGLDEACVAEVLDPDAVVASIADAVLDDPEPSTQIALSLEPCFEAGSGPPTT